MKDKIKKGIVGIAMVSTLALGAVEAQVPPSDPLDSFTKDTVSGSVSHRKYLKERYNYMKANQEKLNIPDAAIDKAIYAQDEFENYLLKKGFTKVKDGNISDHPRGIIKPLLGEISKIDLVQKAYALTFGMEDFESCGAIPCTFTTNGSYGTGAMSLDNTSKVNGTNSLRCDINAANDGCLLYKDVASASTYYIQYYTFYPTGWTFGASGYAGLFSTGDGVGAPVYCNIEDYGTIRITCGGDELGYTDTLLNIAVNTKTRLEFKIQISATTGDLDIWLNNTTAGSPNYNGSGTLNTGSQNITTVGLGGYHPDIVNDHFYDDTCIDTSFMGTLCAVASSVAPDYKRRLFNM